ncbi:MAG TPA: hypothetical protein VM597_37835 [Gemmataceae bacterium]|jgi:hypothetical protein|nr:hypothetical protein [Gemmataceae bacterium]
MRRGFATAALAGCLCALVWSDGVPAQGSKGDGKIENWGRPKDFALGKETAIWLWHDDGVWRLRTTAGGGVHHFQGVIEVVAGRLVELQGNKGEKKGVVVDQYVFNAGRTVVKFDFKTAGNTDGLNFKVEGPKAELRLHLALDGSWANKNIRIGRDGDPAPGARFVVPAHPIDTEPDEPAEKKEKKKAGKKKKD